MEIETLEILEDRAKETRELQSLFKEKIHEISFEYLSKLIELKPEKCTLNDLKNTTMIHLTDWMVIGLFGNNGGLDSFINKCLIVNSIIGIYFVETIDLNRKDGASICRNISSGLNKALKEVIDQKEREVNNG